MNERINKPMEPVAWINTNGAVNKLRENGWAMNAAPIQPMKQEPVGKPMAEQDDWLYNPMTGKPMAEQEKQEPVACEQCEELSADKARWYRMADMFAQQAQELKGVLRQALNLIEGEWPEGDEVAQPVVDKIKKIVGERHDT